MKDLKAKMKATGADFGMAFDLDGDRGAIVVPVPEQIDESGFTVLSPDAITQALIPFYAKRGYTTKEAGKIAIVTDRLSSKAVVDMGKRYGIEVYRVNAGYPNLKAKTRELKAQGYTVVSLAEKSGHTWTDGTGLFEDPIVVGAYFAQMVKESNTKSSRFPFYDAFTANTIPYKVSTRFQPVFHDAYKEKLIREYAQNRREGDPEKLEGVALVAAGLDQAITTLSKHFKPGTEFKTPAGTLVVKSFEIDYDLVVKTKQVCADISFTLNGKDAGTFIFRASSNDPSWVFAYETPIYGNETQESESMKLRFTSVGGVVLEYLENAELATVMGVSYTNSEEAQAVLQAYRDGRAFGSTTEKGAAATPDETQDMTSAETRQLTDQKAPEKFKRSEQGSASMKFIVAAAGVLGAITLVPLVIANPAIAAAIAAALAVTGGAVVLAMYAWKAKKEGTTLLNVLDIHLISGPRALKSAVREFGAASKDDQGNVRTEIFTGKLLPEDAAELELKNLGIKVNGKTVWVSAKAGALFVCTDGANDEAVVQALNEMLSGKGKMRGNGRFLKRLAAIAKDAKIDLKDRGFVPGIIIDHMAKGNEISYNKDGSMVVSAGWFRDAKNNSKIDPIQTGRMLGALMTVRNAESVAMSQNILTAVTNEADLVENLEIFSRAGNGQIMVDAAVFTRMSDEKIMQLAELARRSGVRLYADVMTNTELGRKLTGLGLSGYMAGESNKDRRVYDTVISPSGTRASVIIGGEQMTNEQFRDSILRAETPMKVIYLSELKKRLMEGRDIVDRVDLSDLLNTAALRLYQANNITPEFVMNAAYGWSKDALPSLPQDVLGLVKAVSSGKISEVLALLGGENTAVKIYIDKLASRTNGEALQRSFLRGITENMLAQAKLKEVGKEQGLVDRDLEKLLGQKLFDRFAQMEKSAAGTDTFKDEGAESFMKTYGQRTASQFFGVLVTEVMRLSSKEFTFDELQQSDPEAKAINTIIELITQLGEPKVLKGTEKAPQIFDAHSVNSVLAAA